MYHFEANKMYFKEKWNFSFLPWPKRYDVIDQEIKFVFTGVKSSVKIGHCLTSEHRQTSKSRARKYAKFGVFYAKIGQSVPSTPEIFVNKQGATSTPEGKLRSKFTRDRHHGFELSRSADRHSYFVYPSRYCMHARTTYWKVWKWLFLFWYSIPNIPKWLQNLRSRSPTDSTRQ